MLDIIDGGNSTYLRELGYELCPKIWSAKVLIDDPDAIEKIHGDFINAGSNYITTTNYSVTPYYQEKKYFNIDELISLSGKLAKKKAIQGSAQVLGSIPPYSESYSKDMIPDDDKLYDFYIKTVSLLEPNIDIFLCETMSTFNEVIIAINCIKQISTKSIWVSFSISENNKLKCGTDIKNVYEKLANLEVEAMLFNCCPINIIEEALIYLKDVYNPKIKLGAYPNLHVEPIINNFNLEKVTNNNNIIYSSMTPIEFKNIVKKWYQELNISIIGGCCGIGPKYIRELRNIIVNKL